MKTVVIKRVTHKCESRLMLHFKYDPELVNLAKQVEGVQWSNSNKCWHVPDRNDMLGRLFRGVTLIAL